MIRTAACSFLGFAAAIANAQTVPTIPIQNVSTEGLSVSFAFGGSPGYQLTQTIYESRLVYRSIQSYRTLHFRPDAGAGSYPLPAATRHLTVHMSSAGVPSPERASVTSFQANRGTDYVNVLNDKPVSFPAVGQRPAPAPFVASVPLDRPFPTFPIGHLLVEIETRPEDPTQRAWLADAEQFPGADWTILTSIQGTECPAGTVGYGAWHQTSSVPPLLGTLRTTMSMARQPGQPPSHPGVAVVGSSLNQWGPFPLPLRLDLLGAPGCSVYTNVLASYPGMTGGGSAERFTLELPVPRNFGLLGARLHTQSFIADPTANALGLRASPVATFLFSSPPDPYKALTLSTRTRGSDRPEWPAPNRALVLGVN